MDFHTLCVLGLGYIGLPSASMFATHGLKVIGVDVNPQVLSILQNGEIHIHEPGLRTLVQAATRSGNLMIHPEPSEADAFIIAVPTPFYEDKRADLSYVTSAAESIVPHLRMGNLVVLESTSPPRTTVDVVAPILEKSGLKAGRDFYLAYTPERVLPGKILNELVENARVIGGVDPASAQAGRDLYTLFVRGEIITTDATTAEMVKLMENTYRDANIAISNEFSRLADRFGIDVWEAIALANRHPRVRILQPGPGVGGHCISVDPWFLVEAAPDLAQLIATARKVNDSQPAFVVDLICRALAHTGKSGLADTRIALLGLSYKADVDDLRESPSLEIACRLRDAGAQVIGYEPNKLEAQFPGIVTVSSLEQAVEEAELVVLLVAHAPFKQLHPSQFGRWTKARLIIDTVNLLNPIEWQQAGFQVYRLGDGKAIQPI